MTTPATVKAAQNNAATQALVPLLLALAEIDSGAGEPSARFFLPRHVQYMPPTPTATKISGRKMNSANHIALRLRTASPGFDGFT